MLNDVKYEVRAQCAPRPSFHRVQCVDRNFTISYINDIWQADIFLAEAQPTNKTVRGNKPFGRFW